VKPSKATIARRVEEFVQIILDGAEPHDLRQYVSEMETKEGSPWKLAEGMKSLSDRQIRRYAVAAEKVIAESVRTSRKKIMRRHLARRRNLYAKAVSQGDMRTALAVLADEGKLLHLYDEVSQRAPKSEAVPTAIGDVVKLLGTRLAQIDQSDLPTGEKARLTAALSDTLLRAVSVETLEKQLAELSERVGKIAEKK
jgi:hypothetical protein